VSRPVPKKIIITISLLVAGFAVLFGVTHVGPDFQDGLVMLPVLAAVTLGGLIAGVLVRRTGSLLLPIAVHAAFDVPLYYAFACRLPA